MRLTTVILIASLLQVSAASFGQRITLNQKNAQLESIFKEIRKQTGYNFYYDGKALTPDYRVSVSVKNATVEETMRETLKGLPLSFEINENGITIKKAESSALADNLSSRFQAIDIRGKVVDSLGNGLPGATVRVKNGKGSTSTDAGGNFVLKNLEEGATLIVNYLGYASREITASKEFNFIKLRQSESKLDEVQVIAYGTSTKRLGIGNIVTIRTADIEKQPVNNPLYALQGRVAGLQVTPTTGLAGGAVNLKIRGQNSLNYQADPLIVVDGLPIQNNIQGLGGINGQLTQLSSLNFINPSDIESIAVLKDADATSIYGSRGANGVILITSKKGRSGPAKVDLNLKKGWGEVSSKIKTLNTQEYLQLRKEAFSNTGFQPDVIPPTLGFNTDLLTWDQNKYTDWQKELIGGIAQYNDFQGSISGGGDNVQYLIGGNYHKETTVFPGKSEDKKGTIHFNLSGTSSNQKFKAAFNASYMSDLNTLPGFDFTQLALTLPPNAPDAYTTDGVLNWDVLPTGGKSWNNPFAELGRTYTGRVNNLISTADFSYLILPSLTVKTVIGFSDLKGKSFKKSFPFEGRSPEDLGQPGSSSFGESNASNLSVEPQINYRLIIKKGVLDALLGSSYQSNRSNSQSISAYGFTSDAFLENLASATTLTGSNYKSQYKYVATFARFRYNWDNKYLINVTARRDGSSRFGPGNQFGNFGSVGAAWIFSEEGFVKKAIPALSYGKLRFSYGSSGNDGISDYAYLERYRLAEGQDPYQGIRGYITNGLFNQYYQWETTRKMEAGFDAAFFNDRLILTAAYFKNRSSNQLVNYPTPLTAGPGALTFNLPALIQNSGYELTLRTENLKSKDFSWTTDFNFTSNRNKLISYPDFADSPYYYTYEIGQPFSGSLRLYDFVGVDPTTGKYQFRNADGEITDDPENSSRQDGGRTVRVMTAPKFYGGISNSLSYHGFRLDFFVQFAKQKGINPITDFVGLAGQQNNLPIEFLSRWNGNGSVSEFPKLFFNTPDEYSLGIRRLLESNGNYTDASFIRLKNVSLSYSFPKKWTDRMNFRDVRIFLLGQNLYTITNYKGLDPETQSNAALPPLRIFTTGLQLTF